MEREKRERGEGRKGKKWYARIYHRNTCQVYVCVCVCVAVRARIVDTRTLCGHVCGVCLRGWPHVSKTFRKPFQVQVGNPFSDVGAE